MKKPKKLLVKTTAEQFDAIIERALEEANRVPCSVQEYIENLQAWINPFGPIVGRIDAAKAGRA